MRGIGRWGWMLALLAALAAGVMVGVEGGRAASAEAPAACVSGPHSGHITADETWCLSDSPHQLSADVTVDPGVTLTIEAGVTVEGDSGFGGAELRVEGTLEALGTITRPITFTSIVDTGPYQWSGLAFEGGTGRLRYVTVRYAGQDNTVLAAILGSYQSSDLAARNSTLTLDHVTFRDVAGNNHDYGLVIADSAVVMTDTLFTGLGGGSYVETERPMVVAGPATDLVMHGSRFTGNSADRVLLLPDAMMGHDATLYPQPELEGYEFQDDFTIPPTYTLTLEPGVTVMGCSHSEVGTALLVQGHLEAVGTPTEPITFTTTVTDDMGGLAGWTGLIFDGSRGRGTGHLRYTTVMFGGDPVYQDLPGVDQFLGGDIYVHDVLSGEVRIEDSQVISAATFGAWHQPGRDYGLFVDNSRVVLSGTLLSHIGDGQSGTGTDEDYPLHISGAGSVITLTRVTFENNHFNRALLWPGAMMGHDAVLPFNATLESYELVDDFTVPPTCTLRLEPGVTLMGRWEKELRVEGRLEALGTPEAPITITSAADSASCQWPGLVFAGGTGDLRYTTVRYGGGPNSVLIRPSTGYHDGANITVYDVLTGEVHLEHVTVRDEYHFDGWHFYLDHGIYIEDSNVSIEDSTIVSNGDGGTIDGSTDSGLFVWGDSRVLIEGSELRSNSGVGLLVEGNDAFVVVRSSSIGNNTDDGVRNRGRATLILGGEEAAGNAIEGNQGYGVNQEGVDGETIATYNWWGDTSGPTHSGNPGGTGEEVTDRVLYDPWLEAAPTLTSTEPMMVQLAAPQRVAAGDTVDLGLSFRNLYTETLRDAIVVLEIPWRAEYRYSVPDGDFWPLHNRVIWKLGDVPPGESFEAIVEVWYKWGTPAFTVMPAVVMVAADNLRHPWVAYEEHLAYEEMTILDREPLTPTEVAAILAGDDELRALYEHLRGQGFEDEGDDARLTLEGGAEWIELRLIDPNRIGEVAAVRRIGEDRHIRHETDTAVAFYDLDGGARFDYMTAEWSFWGNLGAGLGASCAASAPAWMDAGLGGATFAAAGDCPDHDWGDCLRNCLISSAPREMAEPALVGGSHACQACAACSSDCLDVCSQCSRDLWKEHPEEEYHNCARECAESHNWNHYQCDGDRQVCFDAPRNESKFGRSEFRLTYRCDGNLCEYLPTPTLEYCPHGCAYGDSDTLGGIETHCIDCTNYHDFHTWQLCTRELVVHDPNALYGPSVAFPGEWLTYTVEWENVGEGTAYGVYVESTLPEALDAETLRIGGGGTYFPQRRTILWEVGEVAGGAGGSATYTVRLPDSVPIGSVMVAEGVVYFPSVPETTPTNPVVTLVGEIAAHSGRITTTEGVPISVTLTGSSPLAVPLTCTLVQSPSHGTLLGTPPDLTYVPDAGFEGADTLDFTVSDGTRTSLPARMTILVGTGSEATPPSIALTFPRDGAQEVWVSQQPLHDTVYAPDLLAYADEPLDGATVTTATVALQAEDGSTPAIGVEYDESLWAIRITPHEPLHRNTHYTVTLGIGITDSSGNPLAEAYRWSFATWSYKVYLPFVLR